MDELGKKKIKQKIREHGLSVAFRESIERALEKKLSSKLAIDFWGRYLRNRSDDEECRNLFKEMVPKLSSSEVRECYGRSNISVEFSSVSSFKESLNRRKRVSQLGGVRHEWKVSGKRVAPLFCRELGVESPQVLFDKVSSDNLPIFKSGVVKPVGGGGGNGVFLKHGGI